MNNLKRVLSLGLTGTMLTGLMAMGAGAANFGDADKISHTEAVNTMVALGVLNGKDTGNYDPEGIVTRAEMAKIICVMLNGGNTPTLGTKTVPTYSDIKGHWAESYIEYCSSIGVIAGQGDGTFAPDTTVTGSAAAKMLLVALGYDTKVFGFTGLDWEINTNVQANNAKLYDGLKGMNASVGLTRDNAAQMAYNATQAYVMTKSYDSVASTGEVTYKYNLSTTTTFLNDKFDAYTFIGTFDGNHDTDDTITKGEIKVTGDLDTADTTVTGYTAKEAKFVSDLDISNIGEEVKVIFKDGKSGTAQRPDKNDTIYGVFNTGKTTVINATKNDIADDYTTAGKIKIDGTAYSVIDETDDPVTAVVRNYGAKDDIKVDSDGTEQKNLTNADPLFKTYKEAFEALAAVSGDTIKFVANDDGKIYRAYVVETVLTKVTSASSSKVTLSGVGSIDVDDNNVAEGLKVDDIVTYTQFYNSDKDDAYFTVAKAETVSGEVTGYTGTTKVSIDGTSYKIVGKALQAGLTEDSIISLVDEVGTDVTAYVVNGMVVAIDKDEESASSYALVIGSNDKDTDDSSMSEGKVKLLLSDGSKVTYVVDEDSDIQLHANSVVAGKLVKYSLNSDSTVEIKSIVTDKANEAVWNKDTKIVADTAVAASDAVLYVKTSADGDYKVYDVRSLKSISTDTKDVYYVTNSAGKITAAYVDLGSVPSGATSDTLYGMIIAENGVVKIDDTYYTQFVVWTGEEITINVKGQSSTLKKGNYVVFDESNDGTYASSGDVTVLATVGGTRTVADVAVKEYSSSDKVLSYYTDLYKNADGKTYAGKTLKTAALDDDAVIIYVNRDDKKAGDETGIGSFDTSTGYANVKMVTDTDTNGVIVALLVETSGECDVNGNETPMGNTQLYAVAAPAITAPVTGTAAATYPATDFSVVADIATGADNDVITFTITYKGSTTDINDTFTFTPDATSGADGVVASGTITGIAPNKTFTCTMTINAADVVAPVIDIEATTNA